MRGLRLSEQLQRETSLPPPRPPSEIRLDQPRTLAGVEAGTLGFESWVGSKASSRDASSGEAEASSSKLLRLSFGPAFKQRLKSKDDGEDKGRGHRGRGLLSMLT